MEEVGMKMPITKSPIIIFILFQRQALTLKIAHPGPFNGNGKLRIGERKS